MNLVLTGSTSGIGWETLLALLPHFDRVFLPVRNQSKAEKLIQSLQGKEKIVLIPMDHLGHFLLVQELLPALLKGKARIIQVSSEAHRIASHPGKDFSLRKPSNTVAAYAKVKLYNILLTNELKSKYESEGLTAYSLHPGAVRTAFGSEASTWAKGVIAFTKLFFISPKAGAATTIFLATAPEKSLKNGGYYVRQKLNYSSSLAHDEKLSQELWNFSLQELQKLGLG